VVAKKKHKGDISILNDLRNFDDCEIISKIDSWEIDLQKENNCVDDTFYPDWYGYKRIDII